MEGTTLGPYQIIEPLGSDQLGHAYRAHDPQQARDVVLKVPPDAQREDPVARATWLRMARAAAILDHPNICRIYEVSEVEARPYVAMELVEGVPLERAIPAGGMDVREVYERGLQLVEAAAHAHEKGVLLSGVSAVNIVVMPDGAIKLDVFAGASPAYMAPERLRGESTTTASDVWSLGVALQHMATGVLPFTGASREELESAILERAPHPLPETVPTLLHGIVSRCLAKLPRTRFQHAGELRAAIDAAKSAYKPRQHPSLAGPSRSSARHAVAQSVLATKPAVVESTDNTRLTQGVVLGVLTTLLVIVIVIAAIVLTSSSE